MEDRRRGLKRPRSSSMARSSVKDAAEPTRKLFDLWNSSATGHQRADNRLAGSTSWRDSRTKKLKEQLRDTSGRGGRRVADSVGAGSESFGNDGRLENGGWMKGAPGLRTGGQQSIQESVKNQNSDRFSHTSRETNGDRLAKRRKVELEEETVSEGQTMKDNDSLVEETSVLPDRQIEGVEGGHELLEISNNAAATPSQQKLSQGSQVTSSASTVSADAGFSPGNQPGKTKTKLMQSIEYSPPSLGPEKVLSPGSPPKQIFTGLNFYINGSTYPIVSDHKLKQLIGQHGGSVSLGLARRTVTHVIVGELSKNGGCGGGLAGSKIQKEAALGSKGEGVKYIKPGWIVECVKQRKRVSEAGFQPEGLGIGGAKQRSVFSMLKR